MELDDCAFPLLDEIVTTDDADRAFEGELGSLGRI